MLKTDNRLHIVLFQPEIPQNTGNIARTCACLGAKLHLVEPMGFRLTERNISRSGMDYWDDVEVERYSCTDAFMKQHEHDELYFLTGQSSIHYDQVSYGNEVYLILGRESRGLDQDILDTHQNSCIRIPMKKEIRSLNLSNAAAIVSYEVVRTWGFAGLE